MFHSSKWDNDQHHAGTSDNTSDQNLWINTMFIMLMLKLAPVTVVLIIIMVNIIFSIVDF